jgi:hypothetical protein
MARGISSEICDRIRKHSQVRKWYIAMSWHFENLWLGEGGFQAAPASTPMLYFYLLPDEGQSKGRQPNKHCGKNDNDVLSRIF